MRPTNPFLRTIAFTPADAARASSASETALDPVLEIVTFRLVDGVDPDTFVDAARGTEALLRNRGALVHRSLGVDTDGLWSDVIEWTSEAAALDAAREVSKDAAFQPFMSMIDPKSAIMRHTTIRWKME